MQKETSTLFWKESEIWKNNQIGEANTSIGGNRRGPNSKIGRLQKETNIKDFYVKCFEFLSQKHMKPIQ